MRRLSILILCGLVPLTALWAQGADFSVRVYKPSEAEQNMEAALDTAGTFPVERAIARDFQSRYPDDVTVQIQAGSVLAMDNLDSLRATHRARAEREPRNAVALFLAGWFMGTPDEQRTYADRILAFDPQNYWGNVLLAGSLSPDTDPGMKQAEAALRTAIATDNSLPMAVEKLGHLLRMRGDKADADAVFVKLGQMLPDRFQPVQYRVMLAAPDQQRAVELIDAFLKKNPQNLDALYSKSRAERELSNWPGFVAVMRQIVTVKQTGDRAYDLACAYSLASQPDSAFKWLFTAADSGYTDIEQYKSDEDLVPLRSDPRWSDLLVHVQNAEQERMAAFMRHAAETAPQRQREALEERKDIPAPEFSLVDLDGKTVSLSSLRGKVVILDFWATWCGPCRKTMPLLDKFYTEMRPENVVVYGINVWERKGDTSGVRPFLSERGTHFPILFGSNETASDYGVRGIPTLVVIDQQGKIAFRHIGYDPTLPEMLKWQTEELLKK